MLLGDSVYRAWALLLCARADALFFLIFFERKKNPRSVKKKMMWVIQAATCPNKAYK